MKARLVLALFIVIVFSAATAASVTPRPTVSRVSATSYEDVGIGKREPIPGNLPWYALVVFGDNRPSQSGEVEYNPVFYHLVDELEVVNPHAVIGTGDHVWNGYVDQIQHFIYTTRNVPNLWVVAGNHEWNNKPYVDSSNYEGVQYWRQHVAPDLYYKDDIPGWRIVFINLRAGYPVNEKWSSVESWLRNNAFNTDRELIVVFHEDLHPKRRASKAISQVLDELEPLLDQYRPKIVFQGHIHCYHSGSYGGTLYVITGGGGAPRCNDVPHHYVVLVIKGTGYTLTPVDVENYNEASGYGMLRVIAQRHVGYTLYRVYNYKRDINGKPVYMPVRITFTYGGETYNIMYYTPPSTMVTINVSYSGNAIHIDTPDRSVRGMETYVYTYDGQVWLADKDGDITIELNQTTQPPQQEPEPGTGTGGGENQTSSNETQQPTPPVATQPGNTTNETAGAPETEAPPAEEAAGNTTSPASTNTSTGEAGSKNTSEAAGGGTKLDMTLVGIIVIVVVGAALYPLINKLRY